MDDGLMDVSADLLVSNGVHIDQQYTLVMADIHWYTDVHVFINCNIHTSVGIVLVSDWCNAIITDDKNI